MATIAVKQDGSGDATTIQGGLNLAANNDIIEIQDSGTYSEGEIKTGGGSSLRTAITIRAASGQTPILDGGGTEPTGIEFYNDWVIEGLTLRNYDPTSMGDAALGAIAGVRTVTINNCTIHSIAGDAITGLKAGSVVKNCTIYNITGGSGVNAGINKDITIKNCLIYDTYSTGIQATNTGVVVEHCTLYNTSTNVSVAGYGISATLGTVKFCIVVNPEREDGSHKPLVAGVRAATTSYNCVTGSEAGSGTYANYYNGPSTGDIQTDPLISSSSFKVSEGSPTLGGAVASTRIDNKDIEGTFVTWQISDFSVIGVDSAAPNNDMGAFEFQPTSVCGVKTENISKVLGTSS